MQPVLAQRAARATADQRSSFAGAQALPSAPAGAAMSLVFGLRATLATAGWPSSLDGAQVLPGTPEVP